MLINFIRVTVLTGVLLLVVACTGSPTPDFEVAVRAAVAATQSTQPMAAPDLEETDCLTTAASQAQLDACAASKATESAQKLSQLIEALQETISAEKWNELQALQTQWEPVRDANCTWEASFFEAGSIQPANYQLCLADYNQQRIDRLKIFLCEGAGMTGPCPASEQY
ncbi:MAG: DUF1311 domain-containing protein [Anaerolineaceae bacterium]|nr:DUF1311 domain-containing protein [Anaerolineaceae bacterium]